MMNLLKITVLTVVWSGLSATPLFAVENSGKDAATRDKAEKVPASAPKSAINGREGTAPVANEPAHAGGAVAEQIVTDPGTCPIAAELDNKTYHTFEDPKFADLVRQNQGTITSGKGGTKGVVCFRNTVEAEKAGYKRVKR